MKLGTAEQGQVVRNVGNGSHYRFERPEKSRARIRPLELFPNGLLIPKPTDTLVDPGLEVLLIGLWQEGLTVEGKPTHGRRTYEQELERREADLIDLRAAYELLPTDGKGKLSRGSWANKIKNCEGRIAVLRQGLAEITGVAMLATVQQDAPTFRLRQLVQLPSGWPAQVERIDGGQITVFTQYKGTAIQAVLPSEVLRSWENARVCTM